MNVGDSDYIRSIVTTDGQIKNRELIQAFLQFLVPKNQTVGAA